MCRYHGHVVVPSWAFIVILLLSVCYAYISTASVHSVLQKHAVKPSLVALFYLCGSGPVNGILREAARLAEHLSVSAWSLRRATRSPGTFTLSWCRANEGRGEGVHVVYLTNP